jgi:hypothetical protein
MGSAARAEDRDTESRRSVATNTGLPLTTKIGTVTDKTVAELVHRHRLVTQTDATSENRLFGEGTKSGTGLAVTHCVTQGVTWHTRVRWVGVTGLNK